MGSAGSKTSNYHEKYGGISLRLDQQVIIPGELVQGSIFLNLHNNYPGDKVCLKIEGTELARWIDKEQRSRRRSDGSVEYYYVDVERKSQRTLIKKEIDVYVWQKGEVAPAGQYVFPFQFKAPRDLPGSFSYGGGNVYAYIKYSMEAFVKPKENSAPKLQDSINVKVREMPEESIETKEVNAERVVKACCCLNKGTVSMRTAFEKNAYAPSEVVRIVSEVDNSQCSVAIKSIRFALIQTIHLSASGHSKKLFFIIDKQDLGRVEPGEKRVGNNRIEASINLPAGEEMGIAELMGEPGDNKTDKKDKKYIITPTTNGKFVRSNFYLSNESLVDACTCCANPPANELSIFIYSAAFQAPPELVAPPNWHPQQMPVANLAISTDGNMADIAEDITKQVADMVSIQMPQNSNQPNQAPQDNMSSQKPSQDPKQSQPPTPNVAKPNNLEPQTVKVVKSTK